MANKPIALITDNIEYAIHWAITNFKDNISEINTKRKRIIMNDGQVYVICSHPEDLIGMEIKDYKDVGGNKKPASFFIDMIRLAQTRIR
jgi:hypothetical protein